MFRMCWACLCVVSCYIVWMCCLVIKLFFFFKQKTAYEMRISDWSSDVCSSDLVGLYDKKRIRLYKKASSAIRHIVLGYGYEGVIHVHPFAGLQDATTF